MSDRRFWVERGLDHIKGVDGLPESAHIIQSVKEMAEGVGARSVCDFGLLGNTPQFADLYYAYDIFLHLDDKIAHEALRQIRCNYLIVAEVLNRDPGDSLPQPYKRGVPDYLRILRSHDFILDKHLERPYDIGSRVEKQSNLSFLICKKCPRPTLR